MAESLEFFPGFPLPASDYDALLGELTDVRPPLRVAHSFGSLRALAENADIPTALLAPSTPGASSKRTLLRAAMVVAAHAPGRGALAVRVRDATYRRYRAVPPTGTPLTIVEAADRLARIRTAPIHAPSRVIVVCSEEDPRHPAQVTLARRLGAPVHWVEGGHLFPIVNPRRTAEVIRDAFG